MKLTIITLSYISLMNHILKANYFDSESDSASKLSIISIFLKATRKQSVVKLTTITNLFTNLVVLLLLLFYLFCLFSKRRKYIDYFAYRLD